MKRIIEIIAQSNGAHRNQSGEFDALPDGYAEIPVGLTVPETFPFVNITAENGVVTSITAGQVPEPEPTPAPEPTQIDRVEAQAMYTATMTDTLIEEE